MKFAKGDRVTILQLNERGGVLFAFMRKIFARPDEPSYTVQVESGVYECTEEELSE